MAQPEVRYAPTDDGVMIAYSTAGQGPVTIALVSPFVSQVEVTWEEPALASFVRRLASCARIVLFDRRGIGLSDRSTASGDRMNLAHLASDTKAVLDAVGVEQATLLGMTFGSLIAVQFAVDFPDRTQAVVITGGFAKLTRRGGYDFAANPELVDVWADESARVWGTGVSLVANAPAMGESEGYRQWAARMERHTCSPGMVAAMCRSVATFDVRPVLSEVRAPTLILHRSGDKVIPIEDGRYLAEHIPGAEFVELPGDDHTIFVGDQRLAVDAIARFLDRSVAAGALKSLRLAERKDAVTVGWSSLTPSEQEIAQQVAAGLTNQEVALRLGISRFTVDGRLRRIFAKLGVNSRVELAGEVQRTSS